MDTLIILLNFVRFFSNSEIYDRENGTNFSSFLIRPFAVYEYMNSNFLVHGLFSWFTFWISKYKTESKESIIESKELVIISNTISIITIAYIIFLILNSVFCLEINLP